MTALTLTDFLRARLDEDEAVARAAVLDDYCSSPDGRWVLVDVQYEGSWPVAPDSNLASLAGADAWHLHATRHDPARVLADVEAKRRIVDHADVVSGMDQQIESEWGARASVPWDEDEGVRLLRLLALPYASHQDYRDEWRP